MSEQIELRLTDQEYTTLIHSYVERTMGKESIEQFQEVFVTTQDVKEALYAAVINETVNALLARFINEIKDNPELLAELQTKAEQYHKENYDSEN